MILAVLADPHANLPALQAVLSHVDDVKPDLILCAGDLVGYGPHPAGVIDLIRSRAIPTVRGDHDDAVVTGADSLGPEDASFPRRLLYRDSVRWTRDNVCAADREFLGSLPVTMSTTVRGRSLVLCHGSPRRMDEALGPGTAAATLRRMFDRDRAHIIIAGHTHQPCHRLVDGRHLVNPGAVGRPSAGEATASVALVQVGDGIEVSFIRIPYDLSAVAADIKASGLPSQLARDLSPGPR